LSEFAPPLGSSEPDPEVNRHPLIGRQRYLVSFLQFGAVLAFVLAIGGVLLPAPANEIASYAMVTTLIAVPIIRVLWLFLRWVRRGDRLFAMVAAGLLTVIVIGALAAII